MGEGDVRPLGFGTSEALWKDTMKGIRSDKPLVSLSPPHFEITFLRYKTLPTFWIRPRLITDGVIIDRRAQDVVARRYSSAQCVHERRVDGERLRPTPDGVEVALSTGGRWPNAEDL